MNDSELEQLRAIFEKTRTCTYNFRRSRKGIYQNPSTARDWRRFLEGAEVVLTGQLK